MKALVSARVLLVVSAVVCRLRVAGIQTARPPRRPTLMHHLVSTRRGSR